MSGSLGTVGVDVVAQEPAVAAVASDAAAVAVVGVDAAGAAASTKLRCTTKVAAAVVTHTVEIAGNGGCAGTGLWKTSTCRRVSTPGTRCCVVGIPLQF